MHIIRYPNRAGLLRGANMQKNTCQHCHEESSHGYYLQDVLNSEETGDKHVSIFVCDACLLDSKGKVK